MALVVLALEVLALALTVKSHAPEFEEDMSMSTVCAKFPQLKPLFEYVFCIPPSSAKKIAHD